jgi:hypothetical protein
MAEMAAIDECLQDRLPYEFVNNLPYETVGKDEREMCQITVSSYYELEEAARMIVDAQNAVAPFPVDNREDAGIRFRIPRIYVRHPDRLFPIGDYYYYFLCAGEAEPDYEQILAELQYAYAGEIKEGNIDEAFPQDERFRDIFLSEINSVYVNNQAVTGHNFYFRMEDGGYVSADFWPFIMEEGFTRVVEALGGTHYVDYAGYTDIEVDMFSAVWTIGNDTWEAKIPIVPRVPPHNSAVVIPAEIAVHKNGVPIPVAATTAKSHVTRRTSLDLETIGQLLGVSVRIDPDEPAICFDSIE